MLRLDDPIEALPQSKLAIRALKRLEITTIRDLLYFLPVKYEDVTQQLPINAIRPKMDVAVRAKVRSTKFIRTRNRGMTIVEAVLADESGEILATWFNQPYVVDALRTDEEFLFWGRAYEGKKGLYLGNPQYERILASPREEPEEETEERLRAVYPLTQGITSRWIRFLVRTTLRVGVAIPETLDEDIIVRHHLPGLSDALKDIHFPSSRTAQQEAKRRLIFDRVLLAQVRILEEKQKLAHAASFSIVPRKELSELFRASLPFSLTRGQELASEDITHDLSKSVPMNRLLNGDVGSGKTVVAFGAALAAVAQGYQVTLMAPTEILAIQHFKEFVNLSKSLLKTARGEHKPHPHISIGLLAAGGVKVANSTAKNTQEFLKEVASGELSILIGTHALIYDKVKFKNLALVIVDEQHRFGVAQRAALKNKAADGTMLPHFLSLTATPIPRTLALTMYGDLDISVLDELPRGRKKIVTKVIDPKKRPKVYEFVHDEIKKGRQVYVICPRIEVQSEAEAIRSKMSNRFSDVRAVTSEYEALLKIFPSIKIAMLHGKMKPQEKEEILKDFKDRTYHMLVATSLIEVGIDVPNATIMIIEGAETFGLAQLHQLRGRVGRGELQSYCFLFTSKEEQSYSERLRSLIKAKNGFELAEYDLKIRGPGDFIGTRQSGEPIDRLLAHSLFDVAIIEEAHREATGILERDPLYHNHPLLKTSLLREKLIIHEE